MLSQSLIWFILGLMLLSNCAFAEVMVEVRDVTLHAWLNDTDQGSLDGGVLTLSVENRQKTAMTFKISDVAVHDTRRLLKQCRVGAVSMREAGDRAKIMNARKPSVVKPGQSLLVRMVFHCSLEKPVIVNKTKRYVVEQTLTWSNGHARLRFSDVEVRPHPSHDGI